MSLNIMKRHDTDLPETATAMGKTHHPLMALRQEVDHLFDDFFTGFSLGPFGRRVFDASPFPRMESALVKTGEMLPNMDVVETEKAYTIEVELPGMEEKDIDVSLTDGKLVIQGEKKEERKEEEKDYRLMERNYGSIYRAFRVPETVNTDKVDASYENGVLKINMPKLPEAKKETKKVKVKTT